VVILSAIPFLIHAYEYGPDAGAAGVPGENGSCSQSGCHTGTAVNAGGGSVTVTFPSNLTYTPGATQHLVVTIDDSKERRWGFELTARLDSDVTKTAGSFSPTDKRTQLMCSSRDLVQQLNFNTTCPANLPLEYIEHTLAGYSAIQANPGKYEFDWNPPATDVGSVTIYVAANAANGDLTQNGDHIYTATYSLAAAGAAAPSPTISSGGVLNAASQAIPGLPNSAIAQGSIFIINGNTLGPASPAQAIGAPLQTSLAGTSVQVTVNGTSLAAPVSAVSSTQVTAIMPSAVPVGSGTVTVAFNGQTSAPAPVQVAAANFAFYTLNGSGSGPAQATDANGNPITMTNPAQPGAMVTLAGTGLGAISADDVSQPSMQDISSSVTLYVGSEQASVQYAGRSGAAAGQDQVTFTVPADATGCYVPVAVVVNNITSNFASIAIAPAGSGCSDGNGFTSVPAGNVRLATINLQRTASSPGPTTIDNGSAAFGLYTPSQLMSSLGPFQAASPGGCLVFGFTGTSPSVTDPTQPQALNAGSAITISGSNGAKQLTGTSGIYGAQLASSASGGKLYLDPGAYTLSSPGGSDVGAFQAQVNAPPPIAWTNAANITSVDRSQGVTVTWTGGDPNGFVYVSGNSILAQGNGAMFTCTVPASAGTFTVPPMVTMSLPASASGSLTLMGVSAPVSFTAPGIDIGLATASSGVSQPEPFQ
jgi:uncharacterized protein (TIGR03437 family)